MLWVVAALIEREGRYLVAQRPPGSWMEGYWEFPGGKVEGEEDPRKALFREIEEELGLHVRVGRVEEVLHHPYPDRTVTLLFFRCEPTGGEVESKIGQSLRWATPEEMRHMRFLPADAPLIERLVNLGKAPRGIHSDA